MPEPLVARRTQFSSCDECRRSRVACDAHSRRTTVDDLSAPCTRCLNRNRSCTFNVCLIIQPLNRPWMPRSADSDATSRRLIQWIQGAKTAALNTESPPKRRGRRRLRASHSSNDSIAAPSIIAPEDTPARRRAGIDLHSASNSPPSADLWHNLAESVPSTRPTSLPFEAPSLPHPSFADFRSDIISDLDSKWLQDLYREGFEAVFGSWMGRYSCPFLYVHPLNVVCASNERAEYSSWTSLDSSQMALSKSM